MEVVKMEEGLELVGRRPQLICLLAKIRAMSWRLAKMQIPEKVDCKIVEK